MARYLLAVLATAFVFWGIQPAIAAAQSVKELAAGRRPFEGRSPELRPGALAAREPGRDRAGGATGFEPSGGAGEPQDGGGGTGSSLVLYDRTFEPVLEIPASLGHNSRSMAASGYVATPSGYVNIEHLENGPLHFRAALEAERVTARDAALVVFGDLPMESVRHAIRQSGVKPLGEIPNNAIVVTGVDDLAMSTLTRLGARLLAWTPAFFASPDIGISPLPSLEMANETKLQLLASVFPDADVQGVADTLTSLGAEVEGHFHGVIAFSMEIDDLRKNLEFLTGLPIRALAERGHVLSADEEISAAIQTGEFHGGRRPYPEAGIDGSTQVLAITDTGLSLDATVLADGTPGVPGSAVAAAAGLSHRKVVAYVQAQDLPGNLGGAGDLLTCDGTTGQTHGHVVASVAAGNASELLADLRLLPGFEPVRPGGGEEGGEQSSEQHTATEHGVDGVAPGARIYFVDDQLSAIECAGGEQIERQAPGLLSANAAAARAFGINNGLDLKIHNFAFAVLGSESSYTVEAQDIDSFLHENQDFLVVTAAGNEGVDATGDGNLDYGSIISPGTAKNVLTVSAAGAPNLRLVPEFDQPLSSVEAIAGRPSQGPAAFTVNAHGGASWRIKPDLMAPAQEVWPRLRMDAAMTCVSGDDDQGGPVECLPPGGRGGTSFAAAAVSGAAALVRDYFEKAYAPGGQSGGAPVSLTGPELKAALIASADLMGLEALPGGGSFGTSNYLPRHLSTFTPEQGYGRVQLDKLLPLIDDPVTPSFIRTESLSLTLHGLTSRTFTVLDAGEPLRCVVSWYDKEATVAGTRAEGNLVRDVNMTVYDCGPDGLCANADDVRYNGNYFTEDANFDRALLDQPPQHVCSNDPTISCVPEGFDPVWDCGDPPGSGPPDATCDLYTPPLTEDCNGNGVLDYSEFSLPVPPGGFTPGPHPSGDCSSGGLDGSNNNEAVFLSPEQLTQGRTMRADLSWMSSSEASPPASIEVGLVCTGGLSVPGAPNRARANRAEYTCADVLQVTVLDGGQDVSGSDPVARAGSVSAGVTVISRDQEGALLDTEAGLIFNEMSPGTRYESLPMAVVEAATVPPADSDSLLGVADGGSIEITYSDAPTAPALAGATVSCRPELVMMNILRRGTDAGFGITGGCDPRPRIDPRVILLAGAIPGLGTLVGGDLFLDANEDLVYSVAFENQHLGGPLVDAKATLTACEAGTLEEDGSCTPAAGIQIFDPVQALGTITPGALQTVSFTVHVRPTVTFSEQIQMVFGLRAVKNGLTVTTRKAFHHVLNADTWSRPHEDPAISGAYHYSTDFPTGGQEIRVYAGEYYDPLDPELEAEMFRFQDATTSAFCTDPNPAPEIPCGNATLMGFNTETGEFDEPIANNWPWTFDLEDESWGARRAPGSDPGDNLELQSRNQWQWSNTGECGFQTNDRATQIDFASTCVGGTRDGLTCDRRSLTDRTDADRSCQEGGGTCVITRGTGGVWHTGHAASMPGTPPGRTGYDLGCEDEERPARADNKTQFVQDVVSSPIFFRVHQGVDANGFAYQLEFTRFAYNHQNDTGEHYGATLDPDAASDWPVHPLEVEADLWFSGDWELFNPNNPHLPTSALVSHGYLDETPGSPTRNIREIHGPGSTGPFFDPNDTNKAPWVDYPRWGRLGGRGYRSARVRLASGLPVRTYEDHIDLDSFTWEDAYGPHELRDPAQGYPITPGQPEILSGRRDSFQAIFTAHRHEADTNLTYGFAFDDVVVEWREQHPVADRTPCSDPSTWAVGDGGYPAGGPSAHPALATGCASISWDRFAILEPETSAELTVIDTNAQYGPDGLAGTGDEQAVDSNGDGFAELTVSVKSDVDLAGEMITLTQIALASPVYTGLVGLSSTKGLTSDGDGLIFIQENGRGLVPVAVSAHYVDQDINVAGAGFPAVPCPDNPLIDTMLTQFVGSDVLFITARVTDEGTHADGDGMADPGETVRLDISVINTVLDDVLEKPDLEGVTLTLISEPRNVGPDRGIACILDGSSYYGLLESGVPRFNDTDDPFRFVVGNVQRTSSTQVLQAEFTLGIHGRYVDSLGVEHQVASFRTPQRFAINLDLDVVGTASPLTADQACVGGGQSGRVCSGPADCPGTKGDGSPATCEPLPARFQAGGDGFMPGEVGYFESFEGAVNMGGRESGLTAGPWPDQIEGTRFLHSPALNVNGGYLDGGLIGNYLDCHLGPLTPGATPGGGWDEPEGSWGTDGSRCPYNDPRGPSKHWQHEYYCRPWDGSAWHANDNMAFSGGMSMYSGVSGEEEYGEDISWDSNHFNALFAAFTPPLHVGVAGNATLSIHHIVQMADYRLFDLTRGDAMGRSYLEWAEVDANGVPISCWYKLNGFLNNYDNRATRRFYRNCVFKNYDEHYDAVAALGDTPGFDFYATSPVGVTYNADDVASEDDYFDPNDPERLYGPSHGCHPQFVYSSLGDYTSVDTRDSGNSFTDGELGETGRGVWVNSLFNLDAAAGKTIRIRFVMTDIDLIRGLTWADYFGNWLGNATRGWRLDDVAVSGLVDQPLTLVPDLREPPAGACPDDPDPGTPLNEAACGVVTAEAGADVVTPVSGSVVALDASASDADQCVNGYLEYRWRLGGTTFKEYSTDPVLIDAPLISTVYTVDVRCSTDPECLGSDSVSVVPADEFEASGSPGGLGRVELSAPGGGPATAAVTRWLEPVVGGPHTVSVLGVAIAYDGIVLRDAGGQHAATSTLSGALRDKLCNLGVGTSLGDGEVELIDTVSVPEIGEVVGYLAITTNAQGIVGTLGRGEQIGPPPAFARGRRTPGSLPACTP